MKEVHEKNRYSTQKIKIRRVCGGHSVSRANRATCFAFKALSGVLHVCHRVAECSQAIWPRRSCAKWPSHDALSGVNRLSGWPMTRRNMHRELEHTESPSCSGHAGPEGERMATETEYTLFAYCKSTDRCTFLMIVSSASISVISLCEMENAYHANVYVFVC